jgi:hypothetical protein
MTAPTGRVALRARRHLDRQNLSKRLLLFALILPILPSSLAVWSSAVPVVPAVLSCHPQSLNPATSPNHYQRTSRLA